MLKRHVCTLTNVQYMDQRSISFPELTCTMRNVLAAPFHAENTIYLMFFYVLRCTIPIFSCGYYFL